VGPGSFFLNASDSTVTAWPRFNGKVIVSEPEAETDPRLRSSHRCLTGLGQLRTNRKGAASAGEELAHPALPERVHCERYLKRLRNTAQNQPHDYKIVSSNIAGEKTPGLHKIAPPDGKSN